MATVFSFAGDYEHSHVYQFIVMVCRDESSEGCSRGAQGVLYGYYMNPRSVARFSRLPGNESASAASTRLGAAQCKRRILDLRAVQPFCSIGTRSADLINLDVDYVSPSCTLPGRQWTYAGPLSRCTMAARPVGVRT